MYKDFDVQVVENSDFEHLAAVFKQIRVRRLDNVTDRNVLSVLDIGARQNDCTGQAIKEQLVPVVLPHQLLKSLDLVSVPYNVITKKSALCLVSEFRFRLVHVKVKSVVKQCAA